MNQIYNFEGKNPPQLTEAELQAVLQARKQNQKLRRQIFLLGIASVFSMLALLLFAAFAFPDSFVLTVICIALFGVILIENGVVGVLFRKRYRFFAYL